MSGFCFITADLIRQTGKPSGAAPSELKTVRLGSPSSPGRIKTMEGLENLTGLECLDLSNNAIERIDKLDRLTRLTELHLQSNAITQLSGLQRLHALRVLNVDSNRIAHLPRSLSALRALRTLRCRSNRLETLQELEALSPLANLTSLSVVGNPFTETPHWRLWTVYKLPGLEILDSEAVTTTTREEATNRLAECVAEREDLSNQLGAQQAHVLHLEARLTAAEHQVRHWKGLNAQNSCDLKLARSLSDQRMSALSATRDRVCELEQNIEFQRIEGCERDIQTQGPETGELEGNVLLLSNELNQVRVEMEGLEAQLLALQATAHSKRAAVTAPSTRIDVDALTDAVAEAADRQCQNSQFTVNEICTFLDERTPFDKFAQWLTADGRSRFRHFNLEHSGSLSRADLKDALAAYVNELCEDRSDGARRERYRLALAINVDPVDDRGETGMEESEIDAAIGAQLAELQLREAELVAGLERAHKVLSLRAGREQREAIWDGCEELGQAIKHKWDTVTVPMTAVGSTVDWLWAMAEEVRTAVEAPLVALAEDKEAPGQQFTTTGATDNDAAAVLRELLEQTILLIPDSGRSWNSETQVAELCATVQARMKVICEQNVDLQRHLVAIAAAEPGVVTSTQVEGDLDALGHAINQFAELAAKQHEEGYTSAMSELEELHMQIADGTRVRSMLQEELHLLKNECDIVDERLHSNPMEKEEGPGESASAHVQQELFAANKQIEMLLTRERNRCAQFAEECAAMKKELMSAKSELKTHQEARLVINDSCAETQRLSACQSELDSLEVTKAHKELEVQDFIREMVLKLQEWRNVKGQIEADIKLFKDEHQLWSDECRSTEIKPEANEAGPEDYSAGICIVGDRVSSSQDVDLLRIELDQLRQACKSEQMKLNTLRLECQSTVESAGQQRDMEQVARAAQETVESARATVSELKQEICALEQRRGELQHELRPIQPEPPHEQPPGLDDGPLACKREFVTLDSALLDADSPLVAGPRHFELPKGSREGGSDLEARLLEAEQTLTADRLHMAELERELQETKAQLSGSADVPRQRQSELALKELKESQASESECKQKMQTLVQTVKDLEQELVRVREQNQLSSVAIPDKEKPADGQDGCTSIDKSVEVPTYSDAGAADKVSTEQEQQQRNMDEKLENLRLQEQEAHDRIDALVRIAEEHACMDQAKHQALKADLDMLTQELAACQLKLHEGQISVAARIKDLESLQSQIATQSVRLKQQESEELEKREELRGLQQTSEELRDGIYQAELMHTAILQDSQLVRNQSDRSAHQYANQLMQQLTRHKQAGEAAGQRMPHFTARIDQHESELISLQAEIQQLCKSVSDHDTEMTRVKRHAVCINESLQHGENAMAQMIEKSTEVEQLYASCLADTDAALVDACQIDGHRNAMAEDVLVLQSELEFLKAELKNEQHHKNVRVQTHESELDEVQDLKLERDTLIAEKCELKEQVAQRSEDLANVQHHLTAAHQERFSVAEDLALFLAELDTIKDRVDQVSSELGAGLSHKRLLAEQMADAIKQVETQKREDDHIKHQLETHTSQLNLLRSQIQHCQTKHSAMCQDIDLIASETRASREAAMDSKSDAMHEKDRLRHDIQELKETLQALDLDKCTAETLLSELTLHISEVQSEESLLMERIEEDKARLVSASIQLETKKSDVTVLTAEAQVLKGELSELQSQMIASANENAQLVREKHVTQEQTTRLKARMSDLQKIATKDSTQLENQQLELSQILSQKALLMAEVQGFNAERKTLQQAVDVARQEEKQAGDQLVHNRAIAAELDLNVKQLRQDHADAKLVAVTIEQIKAEHEDCLVMQATAKTDLKALYAEKEALRIELADLKDRVKDESESISTSRVSHATLKSKLQELEEQASRQESRCGHLMQEVESFSKQEQSKATEVDTLAKQISSSRQEMQDLANIMKVEAQQLATVREEKEALRQQIGALKMQVREGEEKTRIVQEEAQVRYQEHRSMLLLEIALLENEKEEQFKAMKSAAAKADLQLQRQLKMLQQTQLALTERQAEGESRAIAMKPSTAETLTLERVCRQIVDLECRYLRMPKWCSDTSQLEHDLQKALPASEIQHRQALVLLEHLLGIMLRRHLDSVEIPAHDSLTFSPITELQFHDEIQEQSAGLDHLDEQTAKLLQSQISLTDSIAVSDLSQSQVGELDGSVAAWTAALGLIKDAEGQRITMHQKLRTHHEKLQAEVLRLRTQLGHYQTQVAAAQAELFALKSKQTSLELESNPVVGSIVSPARSVLLARKEELAALEASAENFREQAEGERTMLLGQVKELKMTKANLESSVQQTASTLSGVKAGLELMCTKKQQLEESIAHLQLQSVDTQTPGINETESQLPLREETESRACDLGQMRQARKEAGKHKQGEEQECYGLQIQIENASRRLQEIQTAIREQETQFEACASDLRAKRVEYAQSLLDLELLDSERRSLQQKVELATRQVRQAEMQHFETGSYMESEMASTRKRLLQTASELDCKTLALKQVDHETSVRKQELEGIENLIRVGRITLEQNAVDASQVQRNKATVAAVEHELDIRQQAVTELKQMESVGRTRLQEYSQERAMVQAKYIKAEGELQASINKLHTHEAEAKQKCALQQGKLVEMQNRVNEEQRNMATIMAEIDHIIATKATHIMEEQAARQEIVNLRKRHRLQLDALEETSELCVNTMSALQLHRKALEKAQHDVRSKQIGVESTSALLCQQKQALQSDADSIEARMQVVTEMAGQIAGSTTLKMEAKGSGTLPSLVLGEAAHKSQNTEHKYQMEKEEKDTKRDCCNGETRGQCSLAEEVQSKKTEFDVWDTNCDGVIDRAEFAKAGPVKRQRKGLAQRRGVDKQRAHGEAGAALRALSFDSTNVNTALEAQLAQTKELPLYYDWDQRASTTIQKPLNRLNVNTSKGTDANSTQTRKQKRESRNDITCRFDRIVKHLHTKHTCNIYSSVKN